MMLCNKSLNELSLLDCLIPEAGLRKIAGELLHNTAVKNLNFSYNILGVEGSVALAETLSYNKSVTELNLQWYQIPEAGPRQIARGLLHSTFLKKPNIGNGGNNGTG